MFAEIFHSAYMEVIFHWRSSSFQEILLSVQSPKLKFRIRERSNQWDMRYSTFNILRSSSIGGRLHCNQFLLSVWSPLRLSSKFESSNHWFLRYSLFCIFTKSHAAGWRVGGWFVHIIMPLRGPILKAETCWIFS